MKRVLSLPRTIPAIALSFTVFAALADRPAGAQPFTAGSIPGSVSTVHGVPAFFWIARTGGPGAPVAWRVLSVAGPAGLTVTTSGGNVAVPGGPPTPFEPWASPGANSITATTTADPPPRVDNWVISVEAINPPFQSVTTSNLTVTHGPLIPLPVPPGNGGGGPVGPGGNGPPGQGGTWNVECFPPRFSPLVIPHGDFGWLTLFPRPNLPPPPNGTTVRFLGAHPNLGPTNPGGVVPFPAPFAGGFTIFPVFCAPEHPDGLVNWILYFKIRSNNPRRVEVEKCTVVCDHTDGENGGVLGAFRGLGAIGQWLLEEAGVEETALESLLSKLEAAQRQLLGGHPAAALGPLAAFRAEVGALSGDQVPAGSAEIATSLVAAIEEVVAPLLE